MPKPRIRTSANKTTPSERNTLSVRDGRVSVSVDPALLQFIDEYARMRKTSRSAVFDQALEMWVAWQQGQMDAQYYTNMSEAERNASQQWTAITTEAAKYTFE